MTKTNIELKDRHMTVKDLSDYIGYKKQTLYNWIHERQIPFHRIGGKSVRFKKDEIDKWIESRTLTNDRPAKLRKMEIGKCKDCTNWGEKNKYNERYIAKGVDARACKKEPFHIAYMKENDCAVFCGHDGGILYGPEFGCRKYEEKTK